MPENRIEKGDRVVVTFGSNSGKVGTVVSVTRGNGIVNLYVKLDGTSKMSLDHFYGGFVNKI